MSPRISFCLSSSFSMPRASSYLSAVRATILMRIVPSWSSNSSRTAPETEPLIDKGVGRIIGLEGVLPSNLAGRYGLAASDETEAR